jgi:hypothetical protein
MLNRPQLYGSTVTTKINNYNIRILHIGQPGACSSRLRIGMTILPVGVDIRRISDPTGAGAGAGAIFHPRVRPAPAPRIGRCIFHFSPMGDPWISEISNFDDFDLVSPPKYPSISKFWSSPIISPTQVSYRNPRWRSSYSPTSFFS